MCATRPSLHRFCAGKTAGTGYIKDSTLSLTLSVAQCRLVSLFSILEQAHDYLQGGGVVPPANDWNQCCGAIVWLMTVINIIVFDRCASQAGVLLTILQAVANGYCFKGV